MSGTGLYFTQLSKVSGTGIDVVPIPVPTPVQTSISVPELPVLMSYLTYRSGIDVVPNLPKCPVPVLTSYRLTKVSGTGIDDVPNLPKCPVPNLPKCPVPVLMSY